MIRLKILSGILLSLVFLNCNNQEKSHKEKKCNTTYSVIENKKNLNSDINNINIKTPLKKNARIIADSLRNIQELAIYADTLIDINGDKLKDLILESYAEAGFGTKYLHTVFIFDSSSKSYIKVLDRVLNFGFNSKSKTFTTTYFGEDIIEGEKYRWEGLNFSHIETATRHISLNEKDTKEWCHVKKYSENKSIKTEFCKNCLPEEYLNYIELDLK